jgi:hypothetical protein
MEAAPASLSLLSLSARLSDFAGQEIRFRSQIEWL